MEPKLINTALKFFFEEKLEKLNNTARKLGMPPISLTWGATVEVPCGSDTIGAFVRETVVNGVVRKSRVALYTEAFLDGEAPKIEGWTLQAVVDLTGSKPLVKAQPYATADLTKYHDTDAHCDHCNTLRQRNDVLVLAKDGETMQIGRNCAANFFRTTNAKDALNVCDWIDQFDIDEDSVPEKYRQPLVTLPRLFSMAAAVVRVFGWVSHKDPDVSVVPTRVRVQQNLFPFAGLKQEDRVTVTPTDEKEAEAVIAKLHEKFLDKDPNDCTDFDRNIQAVVENDGGFEYVKAKNLNYLIWYIAGYQRDLQKEAEERRRKVEAEKQARESEHVGNIKERRDFTLTLEFKRAFGSQYGTKYLQKFRDEDNNVIVWWGTNDVAYGTIVGNTYVFKATVKCHDEYDGVKQTVITRASRIKGELKEE